MIGILAALFGGGGLIAAVAKGYVQVMAVNKLMKLPGQVKNSVGNYFSTIAAENPFINFFFLAGMIVFVSALSISFFYKLLGLKMNGKMQSYVLISPFFVVFCAVVYVGYVQYLRTKNTVYTTFAGANSISQVAIAKEKEGFSHSERLSVDKDHIFTAIGMNLSKAVYDDMCRELPSGAFSKRKIFNIYVDAYSKNTQKNMNLTPFMYAASVGNIAFIEAALENERSHQRSTCTTKEYIKCPNSWVPWDKRYIYEVIHTPYSIAVENGYLAVAKLIAAAAEKDGYTYYTGHFYDGEKTGC